MRHQPKQLALLVSLIGVGVSPYAFAKTDVRIVGMDPSASGIALEVRDATASVRARWSAGVTQRADEDALTLPEPWDTLQAAASAMPRDVQADGSAVQLERAAPSAPESPEAASTIDRLGSLVTHGTDEIQDDAPPMSAHAARLWESLFADMSATPATPEDAAASNDDTEPLQADRWVPEPVDERVALDSQVAATAPGSQPTVSHRVERSEIVVATQSSVVLRSLQAILSDERNEVGAIRADPNETIVATQAGKVLATLSDFSSPQAEPDDPAARRARKRAAAKLMAQAAVAPAIENTSLSASLSAPASAPVSASTTTAAAPDRADASVVSTTASADSPQAMPVDIDLMQPLIAEHASGAASIGDDEQAPLAMEPAPWSVATGVDIDLAAPFAAELTMAAASAGDDEQAPLAMEPPAWPVAMVATGIDIDFTQPFAAEEATAVASTGDEEQAPLAMEPPPWSVATHVDIDIDLALPFVADFVAENATAVASVGDDAQAPLAMEPAPLPIVAVAPPDAERKFRASPFGSVLAAVSEKSLDGVRGGFVTDGLNISFGIERAVYINGSLVTTTSLNVSDLGRLTAGRGAPVISTGTLALIQSGTGNTVASGTFSAGSIGTVIQNTLNGQKIQNLTVINATTTSLGLLKGINLESSLRGAMSDSLRR